MSKKQEKQYKNHKAIIILEDGSLEQQQVLGSEEGTLETETDFYPLENAQIFYDKTNSGFTYIFNLDLPTKIETEKLKNLRRSKVINNIMNYDREKPLDIFKLLPWVVTIIALIF